VLRRRDYERLAAARHVFGDFDPFGDFDLIFGAARLNLKIVEIPVRYRERLYGSTNISRWKHGWLLLKMSAVAASKLKYVWKAPPQPIEVTTADDPCRWRRRACASGPQVHQYIPGRFSALLASSPAWSAGC